MTRETKIGLLVGLAFIIVIGILLSEHLTTTTERPAAPLAEAGHGVREGVTAPGTPSLDQPLAPRPAEPRMPVPIAREILPPQPTPAAQVTVHGPGGVAQPGYGSQPTIIVQGQLQPALPVQGQGQVIEASQPAPIVDAQSFPQPMAPQDPAAAPIVVTRTPTADPFANDPIVRAAAQQGEALVPLVDPRQAAADAAVATANKAREYKAQPGDTLSRIAALLPGGSTKANRDAIVKLNPTLQKDPNKVISGRTYLLPTQKASGQGSGPAGGELVNAQALPKPEPKKAEPKAEPKRPTSSTRIYVVKAGDTLTKIAANEMGSTSHLGTIRKLNEDVLKGGDVIRVNMKLKLPAREMAAS